MPSVLRDFLQWLVANNAALNQSRIARDAGISQSVINKTMLTSDKDEREPDNETYAKIAAAYPQEWRDYFAARGRARDDLATHFAWVLAALGHDHVAGAGDPQLEDALTMTREIFATGADPVTRDVVARFLKSQVPARGERRERRGRK